MRPSDLGERLIAQGFEYGGDDIGMAVDLSTLPEGVPVPEDFVIERVRDEAGLAAWVETLGSGFGAGPVEAEWVGEMYRRLGFEGAWRHYLGLLAGDPVATSTSFFGAGVVGIYFVFTVERARRRGIGAAVTLAALQEASDLGCKRRRARFLGDGLPYLPQTRLRRILQDRALRVESGVGVAETGHMMR